MFLHLPSAIVIGLVASFAAIDAFHVPSFRTGGVTFSRSTGEGNRVDLLRLHASEKTTDAAERKKTAFARTITTRRTAMKNAAALVPVVWAVGTGGANAADASSALDEAARRFRRVPTFAIVNGVTGVPFMILNSRGLATGYFFTDYEGAKTVLEDARKDAKTKDLESSDMWNDATISAVPLEFALKLAKARPQSKAQSGDKYDTVYDIIASVPEMDDAVKIDQTGIFTERGRVPLFYFDALELTSEGGEKKLPMFLRKTDLVNEWDRRFPGEKLPPMKVMDLIDSFNTMVAGSKDERFKKMVVFPPKESKKAAMECEKSRGAGAPYQMNDMIAVGGK